MSRWAVADESLIVGYNSGWTQNEITTYFLSIYTASGITSKGRHCHFSQNDSKITV
jgi:hypothetical protein